MPPAGVSSSVFGTRTNAICFPLGDQEGAVSARSGVSVIFLVGPEPSAGVSKRSKLIGSATPGTLEPATKTIVEPSGDQDGPLTAESSVSVMRCGAAPSSSGAMT